MESLGERLLDLNWKNTVIEVIAFGTALASTLTENNLREFEHFNIRTGVCICIQ
jgi:hypothetical protein